MPGCFGAGEQVFVVAGNRIIPAKVEKRQYGRYVVTFQGIGYSEEGHIRVSGNRLFRSRDEAAQQIHDDQARKPVEQVQRNAAGAVRADEPGDGWGRS